MLSKPEMAQASADHRLNIYIYVVDKITHANTNTKWKQRNDEMEDKEEE